MAQKQPKTDRQSDLKNRLYNMITKAKPGIVWQAESLRQRWDRKRLQRQLTKEIRLKPAYHWQRHDELDAPQQQALDDYITTQEREIALVNICASMLLQGIAGNQKVVGSNPIHLHLKIFSKD